MMEAVIHSVVLAEVTRSAILLRTRLLLVDFHVGCERYAIAILEGRKHNDIYYYRYMPYKQPRMLHVFVLGVVFFGPRVNYGSGRVRPGIRDRPHVHVCWSYAMSRQPRACYNVIIDSISCEQATNK